MRAVSGHLEAARETVPTGSQHSLGSRKPGKGSGAVSVGGPARQTHSQSDWPTQLNQAINPCLPTQLLGQGVGNPRQSNGNPGQGIGNPALLSPVGVLCSAAGHHPPLRLVTFRL